MLNAMDGLKNQILTITLVMAGLLGLVLRAIGITKRRRRYAADHRDCGSAGAAVSTQEQHTADTGSQASHSVLVLLQIPDELLLEIMDHLPGYSLQLLRATCSRFFHLSQNPRFSKLASNSPPAALTNDKDRLAVVELSKLNVSKPKPDQSALLQIPDELLLEIMSHLPGHFLQLLRSTCSRFFWLSREKQFSIFTSAPPTTSYKNEVDRFRVVSLSKLEPTDLDELKRLLRIDFFFCRRCSDLRADPSLYEKKIDSLRESLYCSGCKDSHPRVLFSPAQRNASCDQRICIGREGSVRVCVHKSISWDFVERLRTHCANTIDIDDFVQTDLSHRFDCKLGHDVRVVTHYICSGYPVRNHLSFIMSIYSTVRVSGVQTHDNCDPANDIRDAARSAMPQLMNLFCHHLAPSSDGSFPMYMEEGGHECHKPAPALGAGAVQGHRSCTVCNFEVHCRYQAYESGLEFSAVRMFLDSTTPTASNWLVALDPNSFELVGDQETEGMTWCNDSSCVVGKEFRHHAWIVKEVLGK